MTKVLVLNSGSSSIKYKVFEMPEGTALATGLVDKIGDKASKIKHTVKGKTTEIAVPILNHESGLQKVIELLTQGETAVVKSVSEIAAVGHRVVHGGESFSGSVVINDEVIAAVEQYVDLAPLHNPPNLAGIKAAKRFLPNAPQVAAFDTAFHQTIPAVAYIYPIPYELYEKYKVRKYGFHGTSHRYVARRAAEIMGKDKYGVNVITCHLGNGCSITAVKEGKSVDTSMGLTPLEGVMMGTRSGDIDPAIIFYLAGKENTKLNDINNMLNKKSGLLGVSGVSNDLRNVMQAADSGNERAKLAIQIYAYKVKKYIGSYMAVLNGADAIVFTGGVGENGIEMRKLICSGMENIGIKMDDARNNVRAKEQEVSAKDSKVKVLVIPTDEEVRIAYDTYEMTK